MNPELIEIAKEQAKLQEKAEKIKRTERIHLALEAMTYANKYLQAVGEAMICLDSNVPPKTNRLGYYLANARETMTVNDAVLLDKIKQVFSISDYIFMTTHYDEYSGSHYFRRS